MKTYIEFNTEKGMQATNETDKNFFKLIINLYMEKLWKI